MGKVKETLLNEECINDVVPKNQYNAMKTQYEAKIEMLENKLASHEEFKKNAEEVCASYAVTDALMKQIEERDTEIKKGRRLDEARLYWKNFALVYWSGNQMGRESQTGGCEVWNECLEKCNDVRGDPVDWVALTKICMETPY